MANNKQQNIQTQKTKDNKDYTHKTNKRRLHKQFVRTPHGITLKIISNLCVIIFLLMITKSLQNESAAVVQLGGKQLLKDGLTRNKESLGDSEWELEGQ
jgi:hypothetical protein